MGLRCGCSNGTRIQQATKMAEGARLLAEYTGTKTGTAANRALRNEEPESANVLSDLKMQLASPAHTARRGWNAFS